MIDDIQNKIRGQINRFIFDNGFAPTIDQLEVLLNLDKETMQKGLQALADNHAITLHPNSYEIWSAQPFALFPTLCWVKTKDKQWWGNCPWCSMGIASFTKTDTDIFTKLKGEEVPLTIEIRNKIIVQKDYVVHYPMPTKKVWDNVIYFCSMVIIFRNEAEVDEWCKQHNKPKGKVLPIEQMWELAKIWYGNYIDFDYKHKTKEIAQAMYTQVGLTGEFWEL